MESNKELDIRLREYFEWFHAHPELSYEEYETTKKIKDILDKEGIEILPYELETGLVAIVRGKKQGPVQALRCDIDALPVLEETGLAYASIENGKMHACGHDFHIVAGIGCAILLNERKDELKGTVKIIFQPGEESARGALKILETDAMENVEKIWGFHADPTNEVGVIGIREGYVAAAADKFIVRIRGVGCHGAHPDDGVDPMPIAAGIIQALQTVVSRNINAFHPALISVTRLEAGHTWNVIPETAYLEGTVRTMDKEDRALAEKRMREIVENTAKAYGGKAIFEWHPGSPAVYNDAKMVELAKEIATCRKLQVVPQEQSMGGDDFSFYEESIPGCYIKIGTGVGQTIHQPGFKVDERVILPASLYMAELINI